MAEDSGEPIREQSESVAAANLKVLGDGPAFYTNMSYGNAVAHQQSMNAITEAATGKIVESIIATSPAEGGADAASLLNLLMAAVKAGGNIPPVTP